MTREFVIRDGVAPGRVVGKVIVDDLAADVLSSCYTDGVLLFTLAPRLGQNSVEYVIVPRSPA